MFDGENLVLINQLDLFSKILNLSYCNRPILMILSGWRSNDIIKIRTRVLINFVCRFNRMIFIVDTHTSSIKPSKQKTI